MSGSNRSKAKVYVYNGLGCSDQSSSLLRTALDKHVDLNLHQIEPISGDKIINGTWRTDAALMVFGGGFDLGFIESLGDKGIQSVRDYVWEDGGAYLGLCAGAYFACDSIEFDKAGPLEVCGERHLKFYPGGCIGPAYPGFDYNSSKGAVAAPIDFSGHQPLKDQLQTICLYTDGGGYFTDQSQYQEISTASNGAEQPANDGAKQPANGAPDQPANSRPDQPASGGPDQPANGGPDQPANSGLEQPGSCKGLSKGTHGEKVTVEVLACFRDLPGSPAAIVKCHVGNKGGKAILSGVHFEYSPDKLVPGEKSLSPSVVSKLQACDKERQLLLVSLLSDMGLNTKKEQ